MKKASVLLICVAALAEASCHETRVRSGAAEFASLEESAARVLLSARGISRLVEVTNPDGFLLEGPRSVLVEDESIRVTVGPTEQILPVVSRTSEPSDGTVSLTTRLDGALIFVSIRIESGVETRICRWRVTAPRIETTATLELVDEPDGTMFGVAETPLVELQGETVTSVTRCEVGDLSDDDLADVLVDYVTESIALSAATALPASPVEAFGLIDGNLQLSRVSRFENRRGVLVVEGTTPEREDAFEIDADGLSIVLDATADARRAPCAPPVPVEPLVTSGAGRIDPDELSRFNAHFAIAVSGTWLSRVAQSGALAGYACRGLEEVRGATDRPESVSVQELLLEELKLGKLPLGPEASLVLAPGSLPQIRLRRENRTVEVGWRDLQVEVYGEVRGARTRLARVVADTDLVLRPRAGGVGVARFDIESLGVTTRRLDSEFLASQPADEDVDRWVRRTLLLMFEEQFEFPLPLEPVAPVRVVNMQVRGDDIVAFVRFDN